MQTTNSSWIPSGSFQPQRYNPSASSPWSGHLPFAKDLVTAIEPKLLVELGTHDGESYFGFCQAIAEGNFDCVSYAINMWAREPEAGNHDDELFQSIWDYNEIHYRSFSHLVRSTFDEVLRQFADESIDILHMDGQNTYEAVSHVFHAWFPKVKPGGFILLHDVGVRHADFGVWKLWDELETFGRRFLFHHSWGLGILEKPGGELGQRNFLNALFGGDEQQKEHIRHFYQLCADSLELKWLAERKTPETLTVSTSDEAFAQLREERDQILREKESVLTDLHKARTKAYVLDTQLREANRDLEASRAKYIETQISLDVLKNAQRDLERRYKLLEQQLNGIVQSHSWRLTSPLRALAEKLNK
jgi:hypothetical protein